MLHNATFLAKFEIQCVLLLFWQIKCKSKLKALDNCCARNYNAHTEAIDMSFVFGMRLFYGNAHLEGGNKLVSEVHIKDSESLDSALKRFKRNCQKSGVLSDLRRKEYYQSPSVKRRKKSEAARKNKNKRYN